MGFYFREGGIEKREEGKKKRFIEFLEKEDNQRFQILWKSQRFEDKETIIGFSDLEITVTLERTILRTVWGSHPTAG